MAIAELTCFHARIRLKREIRHASHARRENETLLVRCRLQDGTVGWGESLPREYVTGESIDSTFAQLAASDLRMDLGVPLENLPATIARLRAWRPRRIDPAARDAFGNCAKAAVEIAVLDAVTRRDQQSFTDVIAAVPEVQPLQQHAARVRYSAAIMSSTKWKQHLQAALIHFYGFQQCKVKVGADDVDDVRLLRRVRMWLGRSMDLRIDANEAWTPESLPYQLERLAAFHLSSCEQPIPHHSVGQLARVKADCRVPIMLDESLCSLTDADRAIENNLCDLFNIRLSKCGGLIDSLLIAAKAHAAGKGYQLGCQVGETGILSAAGRHFACGIRGIRFLEGSYDRLLIGDQITTSHFTFAYGGRAAAISSIGHGAVVDEARLQPRVQRTQSFTLS